MQITSRCTLVTVAFILKKIRRRSPRALISRVGLIVRAWPPSATVEFLKACPNRGSLRSSESRVKTSYRVVAKRHGVSDQTIYTLQKWLETRRRATPKQEFCIEGAARSNQLHSYPFVSVLLFLNGSTSASVYCPASNRCLANRCVRTYRLNEASRCPRSVSLTQPFSMTMVPD